MMRPQLRSTMPSATCLVMLNTELRLVFITASQLTRSIFRNVMSRVIPALLTRTSTGPISCATFFTQPTHDSQSVTSHGSAENANPCLCIESSHSVALVFPGEYVVTTL
jgi:hypothetical protein